jgi:hypothetical protein
MITRTIQDTKKEGVSAIKGKECLKNKFDELARNSRKEHRQLYRGII